MPIYEYRRPDGTTFDVIQSFSDEPLTTDPETGVPVERVLRPPAVHFKGKGFYNTDYGTRRRQRETAAAGEGGSGSDSGSGASKSEGANGSGTAGASKDAGASKPSSSDGASPGKKPVAAKD
jgi:putative FmdB family regulatory protein